MTALLAIAACLAMTGAGADLVARWPLDDVCIYDRAPDAEEITAMQRDVTDTQAPRLVPRS